MYIREKPRERILLGVLRYDGRIVSQITIGSKSSGAKYTWENASDIYAKLTDGDVLKILDAPDKSVTIDVGDKKITICGQGVEGVRPKLYLQVL